MRLLGRWTQGLLIACGALYGISALMAANAWSVYSSFLGGGASLGQTLSADDSYWAGIGFSSLVLIATGVVMIIWLYRYGDWLRSLRPAATHRWSRGWTIGGWFIPIGNLWIPKQVVDDLWRATEQPVPSTPPQGIPPMLHWWWATWLAGSILNQISLIMDPFYESGWHMFYFFSMVGAALLAASGGLAAVVVGNLIKRQSTITA